MLKALAHVPWLREAALEAQAPVAGTAPLNFVTGGRGARGFDVESGMAVSLRLPGIRDGVLGGKPAGKAAVETGWR